MADVTIRYTLDLAVRLIDTTTGNPVDEKQAIFQKDGQILTLLNRDGAFILINHGRENMKLSVDVKGYLPVTVDVDYEKLSNRQPEIEVALIPRLKSYGSDDVISIEGDMKGIESITAVQLDNPMAAIGNYIEQKQMLKLFSSKYLGEMNYAVLHSSLEDFEEFTIARKADKLLLKLRSPLEQKVVPEETVVRLIRGSVEDDHYILRIRENGKSAEYLIRYVVNGKPTFIRKNLDDPEGRRL